MTRLSQTCAVMQTSQAVLQQLNRTERHVRQKPEKSRPEVDQHIRTWRDGHSQIVDQCSKTLQKTTAANDSDMRASGLVDQESSH